MGTVSSLFSFISSSYFFHYPTFLKEFLFYLERNSFFLQQIIKYPQSGLGFKAGVQMVIVGKFS